MFSCFEPQSFETSNRLTSLLTLLLHITSLMAFSSLFNFDVINWETRDSRSFLYVNLWTFFLFFHSITHQNLHYFLSEIWRGSWPANRRGVPLIFLDIPTFNTKFSEICTQNYEWNGVKITCGSARGVGGLQLPHPRRLFPRQKIGDFIFSLSRSNIFGILMGNGPFVGALSGPVGGNLAPPLKITHLTFVFHNCGKTVEKLFLESNHTQV